MEVGLGWRSGGIQRRTAATVRAALIMVVGITAAQSRGAVEAGAIFPGQRVVDFSRDATFESLALNRTGAGELQIVSGGVPAPGSQSFLKTYRLNGGGVEEEVITRLDSPRWILAGCESTASGRGMLVNLKQSGLTWMVEEGTSEEGATSSELAAAGQQLPPLRVPDSEDWRYGIPEAFETQGPQATGLVDLFGTGQPTIVVGSTEHVASVRAISVGAAGDLVTTALLTTEPGLSTYVFAGDFDGNGTQEFGVCTSPEEEASSATIVLREVTPDGSGAFAVSGGMTIWSNGGTAARLQADGGGAEPEPVRPNAFASGDLTGAGRDALAVALRDERAGYLVMLRLATGTVGAGNGKVEAELVDLFVNAAGGARFTAIKIADFTHYGVEYLLAGTSDGQIYLYQRRVGGTVKWERHLLAESATTVSVTNLAVENMDSDARMEIVCTASAGEGAAEAFSGVWVIESQYSAARGWTGYE